MIDAVTIANDRVLVMSTGGSGLYIPGQNRWLEVTGLSKSSDKRLYNTGRFLLLVSNNQLQTMEMTNFPQPDSCDSKSIELAFSDEYSGEFISLSEQTGEVVILEKNGKMYSWIDGLTNQLLPETNTGPNTTNILRALKISDGILFSTSNALWYYNTNQRTWKKTDLVFPANAGKLISVDMINDSFEIPVNIWTENGSYFGKWRKNSNSLTLTQLTLPPFPKISTQPDQIVDVSKHKNLLAIAAKNKIEILDTSTLKEKATIFLPEQENLDSKLNIIPNRNEINVILNSSNKLYYFLPNIDSPQNLKVQLQDFGYRYHNISDINWGVQNDADILWRIDQSGILWKCSILTGKTTSNCKIEYDEPIQIESTDIIAAFQNGNKKVIGTNTGWIQLSENYRNPINLENLPPLNGSEKWYSWESSKLLLTENKELYFIPADFKSHKLIATNIRFAKTNNNRLYLVDSSGFRVFNKIDNTFSENFDHNKYIPHKLKQFSPTRNWLSNSLEVIGLDEIGYLISASNGERIGPRIDQSVSIKSVIRNLNQRNVWIQRTDGNIEYLTQDLCVDEYAPSPDFDLEDDFHHIYSCFNSSTKLNSTKFSNLGTLRGVNGNTLLFDNGILTNNNNNNWIQEAGRTILELNSAPNITNQTKNLVQIQNGRSVLAPVNLNDNLIRNPLQNIHERVYTEFRIWSEWKEFDGLEWSRQNKLFKLKDQNDNEIELRPDEIIQNGNFYPFLAGRQLAHNSKNELYHINPKGLWNINGKKIRTVILQNLPDPLGISNGVFMLPTDETLQINGQIVKGNNQNTITIGELSIFDDPRNLSVSAQINYSNGQTTDAFKENGFKHDSRVGTGWLNGTPVIFGPLGIVPVSSYTGFDPAMNRTPKQLSDMDGKVWLKSGQKWYERINLGNWTSAVNPP